MYIYIRSNLNFRIRKDLANKDLEFLLVEISKPRSKPFLVDTWYRPSSSPQESITLFEEIIDKIDVENLELYLLGDLNCNLLSNTPNSNTTDLLNVFDIYNLSQTISEPTRITNTSRTLIDLCITNSPDKVKASDVLSIGISDHSLVYLIRKTSYHKASVDASVEKRNFKNFNERAYLNDLNNLNWQKVCQHNDSNDMWADWLNLLMPVIDKHAPLKRKRIGTRKSRWITPYVVQKIRLRDFLKRKFDVTSDNEIWFQFKKARNECNNAIKQAKHNYFITNFAAARKDPSKTWKLMNELSSCT